MKKCPKCGEIYDDSWGICIKCNTKLHPVADAGLAKEQKEYDKRQKEKEIRLKQDEEFAKKYSASRTKIIVAFIIDLFFFMLLLFPFIGLLAIAEIVLFGFGDLLISVEFVAEIACRRSATFMAFISIRQTDPLPLPVFRFKPHGPLINVTP